MIANRLGHPHLGLGVGLRTVHFDYILEKLPKVDWFEIISENFMVDSGRPLEVLDSIRSLSDLLDAYGQSCTDYERARFRLLVALGIPPAELTAPPGNLPPP